MQALKGNATPSRSWIMKLLVRRWESRYPRALARGRAAVGICLICLGAVLCGTGFWWGALMMVIGALVIVVAGLMFSLVSSAA
jgi:protein-S-isoprenylcysteine O-methyltransferase Ste14